jgi:ABC-type polysaccharide/polyol phosphate export permease
VTALEPWRGEIPGFRGRTGTPSPLGLAIADMIEGARHWPQWYSLGNLDVRLRFRRTVLGPFWTTISFTVLAVALGLVYGEVFRQPVRLYLPYVVLGLFVWSFVATILQEACEAFVQHEYVLKQIYVPRSTILYRTLWRNVLLLGFNLVAVAAILVACRLPVAPRAVLALAGLLLLLLNLGWIALLTALLATRFRAVSRVVHTLMPIAMLVTPVLWLPVGRRLGDIAAWNPLFHAVELVRGPLLGSTPSPVVWAAALAAGLIGWLAALLVFARARPRLPYWL